MINNIKQTVILSSLFIVISSLSYYSVMADSFQIDKNKAEELYKKQCSKCHRNNGEGIKKVYPPIKNADYIKNVDTEELLRGMLFGRSGKVTVNGVTYNGVMTTEIDGTLNDADIGLILSYVYQNFNSMNVAVKADAVKKARKAGKLAPHK